MTQWYAKLPLPVKLAIRTFWQAFVGSLSVTWAASALGLVDPATRMSTLVKLLGPAALAGGSAVFTYLHNLVQPAPGTKLVPVFPGSNVTSGQNVNVSFPPAPPQSPPAS